MNDTHHELTAYRLELRDDDSIRVALRETINDRLDAISNSGASSTDIDANSHLHTLDLAFRRPDLLRNHELILKYVIELSHVMLNAGGGHEFLAFIDKAIQFCQENGYPMSNFYILKADYLGLTGVETADRRKALDLAYQSAQNPEEVMNSLIAIAAFSQSSSQYREAIQTCEKCLAMIDEDQGLAKFLPEVQATLGVAYYYLFDYDNSIHYFEKVLQVIKIYPNEHQESNAFHHLGRIAAAQGKAALALQNYLDGLSILERQPENLSSTAFCHIRIGELLTSANLLKQASDHLEKGRQLFLRTKERSSAEVQIELAFADIYILEKNYSRAEDVIRRAIKKSRARGFPRGELYGLEKLFWLQFRQFRVLQALVTLYQAFMTLRGGEMGRNTGFKLLIYYVSKVPRIVIGILKGSVYNILGGSGNADPIDTCTCSMHRADQ